MTDLKNNPQLRQTAVSRSRFIPMLFSTPMVQAILHGTKTETRRIIKYPKKITDAKIGFSVFTEATEFEVHGIHETGQFGCSIFNKPVNKGDIIWVRETFFDASNFQDATLFKYKSTIIYKADETFIGCHKWKPSLFMPKNACRLFLEVVSVSVERLQDIDEQSAINEGVGKYKDTAHFCDYMSKPSDRSRFRFAIDSYKSLWQKINGQDSYDLNPWVWVYKFRSVSIPADFC